MSKLTRVCIAVAAFMAFAVLPAPAIALNDATLQTHAGATVAVGTNIAGTNTAPTTITNVSTELILECGKSHMHGTVTANSHAEVAATITTVHHNECQSEALGGAITVTTSVGNGTPWCLRASTEMITHQFQVRGNACNLFSRGITFVMHTAVGECRYERANGNPIKGTYTTSTAAGEADLHFTHTEIKRENANFFCPSVMYTDMTLDLEETVGTTDLKLVNAT